jgi:hypothetical protein
LRRAGNDIEELPEQVVQQRLGIGDIGEQDHTLDFRERDENIFMLRVVGIRGVGEGWEDRGDEESEDVLDAKVRASFRNTTTTARIP